MATDSAFHHHQTTLLKSQSTSPMTAYFRNSGGGVGPSLARSGGMIFSPGVSQSSMDSSSSLLYDSVPGLKHDTGLAVEWSIDEQYRLDEGIAKYANEPNIMKYIKIAASLRDKTVRDVALRCKWMARKRRKHEDQNCGKKVKDRKELLAESSLRNNISSSSPVNPFLPTTKVHDLSDSMSGAINGPAKHLLEENNQALRQISVNLADLKLQQNIDLFFRTKNNLITILNDMSSMPGIMSRMPPLPVVLDEELSNSIFSPSSQAVIFSSPMVTSLKQEPGC